jgi:hypothetical protein
VPRGRASTPDGKIAAVTGFATADLLGADDAGSWISGTELFARFGLPADRPSIGDRGAAQGPFEKRP